MLPPVFLKRFIQSYLLPVLRLLLALATPAQAAGEESNYEGPVYVSVVILDVDSISCANQSFTIN